MTAAQVHSFFKDYADAFSCRSADRLQKLWSFPAFMVFGGHQAVLEPDVFYTNTQRLYDFYARQGVVRAEKEVIELTRLTETTATARTADVLFSDNGEIVAQWEHVYLLNATDDGIKVAAAMPDNELRAWRDRGTPLGS